MSISMQYADKYGVTGTSLVKLVRQLADHKVSGLTVGQSIGLFCLNLSIMDNLD